MSKDLKQPETDLVGRFVVAGRAHGNILRIKASDLPFRLQIEYDDNSVLGFGPNSSAATEPEVVPGETATVTPAAFDPWCAAINVGLVQLKAVSPYLADLPDDARAELLVSPHYHNGPTWAEAVTNFGNINGRAIHYDGQSLTGMKISDRPEDAPDVTYEQAWASEVRAAWEQAKASDQVVATGLAIGTQELVYYLYSNIEDVNKAIKAQGGQKIQTRFNGCEQYQCTSTESVGERGAVYRVDFRNGCTDSIAKSGSCSPARPVALSILPPGRAPK